jgi:hypothetical protein
MNKMKKTIFMIFFISFLVNVSGQNKTINQVIALSKSKNEWMIQKDTVRLKEIFSKDLKYIHSNGKVDNLSSIIKTVGSINSIIQKQELFDEDVRLSKNMAVLNGKLHFSAIHNDQILNYTLIITEVWHKKHKSWLLWSRHASRVE